MGLRAVPGQPVIRIMGEPLRLTGVKTIRFRAGSGPGRIIGPDIAAPEPVSRMEPVRGEPANGLQAGVHFRLREAIRPGSAVHTQILVRNVTERPIAVTYRHTPAAITISS